MSCTISNLNILTICGPLMQKKWSCMCKHVLDCARVHKHTGYDSLDKLLEQVRESQAFPMEPPAFKRAKLSIDGEEDPQVSDAESDGLQASEAPEAAGLEESDEGASDEEVAITSFTCRCPQCVKPVVVERDDGNISESSAAAQKSTPMEPSKGGHKKEIQKHDKDAKASKSNFQKSSLVNRKKPLQAYIMAGTPKVHWVGSSAKESAQFKDLLNTICQAIEDGKVTSKEQAIAMKKTLLKKGAATIEEEGAKGLETEKIVDLH